MNPEHQLERKSLYWGILAACFIHVSAIIFLGWTTVKEPEFPYVPLASLDFSPYDPEGGTPGGLLSQENPQKQPAPPAAPPKQVPAQQPEQLPTEQPEPVQQNDLDMVKSTAETAEEIAPLPTKRTQPKEKTRKAPKQPDPVQPPAKTLAQAASGNIQGESLSGTPAGSGITGPNTTDSGKGGSGMGTGRGNPDAEKAYLAHIVKKLDRYKKYPAAARAKRFSGTVTVNFTLNANGNVVASRMVKGSGYPALDQEAMALVQRASPFKAIPQTIQRKTMTLTVPIRFTTR